MVKFLKFFYIIKFLRLNFQKIKLRYNVSSEICLNFCEIKKIYGFFEYVLEFLIEKLFLLVIFSLMPQNRI
jgi:hypothetical protein